jgi:CHAD domain-containing protein
MKRAPWNARSTASANAHRQLPRMMSEYFAQVREALSGRHSAADLHRVRLAGKKVRYTLELFRPCYNASAFDARLTALKAVQSSLGDVNDAAAARRLLGGVMPHSPARRALREFLKQRAGKKAEEFQKHWTEEFDAPGRELWWTGFLGGDDGGRNQTATHGDTVRRRASRKTGS